VSHERTEQKIDYSALLARDEEDLYRSLSDHYRWFNKRMIDEEEGRAKFNALVPDIRTRLCTQWHACEQVKRYEDEASLAMAIGDVLMTQSSTLPVATLAVLVVKIGV
jgi:hypothetical protein